MMKRYLGILIILLLVLTAAGLAIISNEVGTRWLLHNIFTAVPGQVSVEKIEGQLSDTIKLTSVSFNNETTHVRLKHLDLQWQPLRLFSKELKLNHLMIDGLTIKRMPDNKATGSKSSFMDGIKLPLKPNIDKLILTNLQFQSGEINQHIDKIQLSTQSNSERINVQASADDIKLGNLKLNGFASTSAKLPLDLKLTWHINLDKNGIWQGISRVTGDMEKLTIDSQLSAPFTATLNGNIGDVLAAPKLNLQGHWQHLQWPVDVADPQISSPEGHISIQGLLNAYTIKLKSEFNQKLLPTAFLSFEGNGNQENLTVKRLDIKSDTGLFQLSGKVSWANIPSFEATLTGKNFNPAIFAPDFPGSLNINSQFAGNIDPNALHIKADIKQINGQLRKQTLSAHGKLILNDQQLKVNEFTFASGINTLWLNGELDQHKGFLDIDIDMAKLAHLWPDLSGNLIGGGRIHGGWLKPAINLTLTGKQLKFAQHRADSINLDVAFSPDDRKSSVLNLSAHNIASGKLTINKLDLLGKGSLNQHAINLDITSPQGNASTALTGSLLNSTWQGQLAALNLTETNGKVWSLSKPAPIQIEKKTSTFAINVEQTCLNQDLAALCSQFKQSENGDLNLELAAKALPSSLLKPFLPKTINLATSLDGKVNLTRKNKVLTGEYQLATAPTLLSLTSNGGVKQFRLQASGLTGKINGDTVLANLVLNLSASDYLRSQLKLDLSNSQIISGNVNASINDFTPFLALTPQLSELTGQLVADVNLEGDIEQPKLAGFINLNNGAIKAGRFGLQQFNVQSKANTSKNNRIELSGSAIPLVFNPTNNPSEAIDLKSLVNFTANLQAYPELNGAFQFVVPSTEVTLNRNNTETKLVFGTSTLTGQLLNNTLFTHLDIRLAAQDYLKGKLQLGMAEPKKLSAQINTSVQELKIIETLIPELANVKGRLTADLSAFGTITEPKLSANLHFNGGSVDITSLGISINQIELQATTPALTDNLIQLRGSAKSGDGIVQLEGTVNTDPSQNWPMAIKLTGHDFEIAKLPEAQVNISPDLSISSTREQHKITGDIVIPKAHLKIEDIPENAVKVSPDEIILGEEPPPTQTMQAPELLADINVKLGKDVNFVGQGLTTDLKGSLRIIKTSKKTAMQGHINMAKASYKSYGQDLTVRKGQFVFNGPMDNPWLDVEATRLSKDKKVTAILTLTGLLDNPQTRISAEPSLPESEALAYLITGGPLNQVSKSDSNLLASAAISYGADQAGWLANQLGISEFGVQQGNTLKDTLLVMGKYLTPDFYMGAKVGMFNKQAVVVLKHKVYKNFNVETQAGTSQRIKLNYEFDRD